MQKRIVCHITSAHSALDSRIFYREARSLIKAGYSVSVIGLHSKQEVIDGVEIIPLKISTNRAFRMLFKPLHIFYCTLKTGASVVHFHDPELIPVGILLRICRRKVIYDAHEDYPQLIRVKEWIATPLKVGISRATAMFERVASQFFNLTIAPSEPLSKRLPKGITLYNFPTLEVLEQLNNHSRIYEERDIDLIHVGILRKSRIDFFLKVLKIINVWNTKLKTVFVGLSNEQIKYIKNNLDDSNNISLISKVPFSEVLKFLGRSKIGLNYHPLEPHLKYAVPVKIFEYLGAGCVVVAAKFPFLKQLMGEESPVIFVNHNPEEFADKILELVESNNEMKRISEISKNYSLSFSWDKHEEYKLIGAYEKLL